MTTFTRPSYEPGQEDAGCHHPALLYATDEDYLDGVGGFIRSDAVRGRPVLVAVPGERMRLLKDALGADHPGVTWIDMRQAGRNPGRILSMLLDFADRGGSRRLSIVSEPVWADRRPAEIREAIRTEALINLAFAHPGTTVLCPYDTALPEPVLAQVHRTHAALAGPGDHRPSPAYTDPHEICRDCDTPLPEPESPLVLRFGEHGLARARDAARNWAETAGMTAHRRTDWLLAVSEATSNSVRHGGGHGTLRLWRTGDTLIAETRDRGRLTDPLVGRRRPDPFSASGGRGVWMMHQLCDLVETRALPTGLVVRLHMALD
ncbi:sensor histidine kinase [Streptomyces sp. LP11]|uniref:Sensor histidine kinase n=1 Tax=Streptomyces pyxinicus TaxID=2970331 RepID=A0ABT2B745_9ACTN|nr:sensor histidine kinase [Streptomyces sp. LP11]MCS0604333.1 sensor histidine kinase [Streptomyces sp. LP11]